MARPEASPAGVLHGSRRRHGLMSRASLWAIAACAMAAVLVFHHALAYFFSQDDFAGLARARGLLPALTGPWRFLSGQTYFDVMKAVAGLDPFLYHLVSLIAHVGCTVVLFALLARYTGALAAGIGALFFAVHRAHYTAIYSISGIGEILAATFGLGALFFVSAAGRTRWVAAPLFLLSLLCKESTVLLPLVALLVPRPRSERPPGAAQKPTAPFRDPLILTLIAISALYVASFVARDAFGIRQVLPEREPYALGFDDTLIRNLLTYLGWTANFFVPTVRTFADMVDPAVYGYGVAAGILWLAGLTRKELRARGWIAAGALYLAMLLPVLPLRNHTYHYYLYGPLAGAAWCVALLTDAMLGVVTNGLRLQASRRASRAPKDRGERRARQPEPSSASPSRPGAGAWIVTALIGAGLTVNGMLLVRKVETNPIVVPASPLGKELHLRRDPTVDRAIIAANAFRDLRDAPLADGVRLLFWCPGVVELQRKMGKSTDEAYLERNVRIALLDGLAVRVLFPQVREASFVRDPRPLGPREAYAIYYLDGHLRVVQGAEADSLTRERPGTVPFRTSESRTRR